ncbi:MAG: phosphatidylglycerol lysyltransferase domain-containing protein [Alphaproteobacteria bacterium]|nr:phosphatidylglycerol lysyltransferase domain-containing protein [Alphaproteobacteria bacterium]
MAGTLKRLLRHVPALLGVVLFVGAIYVVQKEFRGLKVADIERALSDIPTRALVIAFLWNLLAYGILTFYDRLATIYAGETVSYGKSAFASFCAYTLAHNLGFAAVSGAAVRYRLYAHWGLTPLQIGKVIVFCSLTFGFGGLVLGGSILVWEPDAIPFLGDRLPHWVMYSIAGVMWAVVTAYATLSRVLGTIRIFGNTVELPGLKLALLQIILATVDVGVTAAIFYALLPDAPGLTYPRFLGIYLASYTAGLIANVPGGLGVFDTAILLGLAPYLEPPQIVGGIVVFRLYYYIIPLFLAGGLFAANEVLMRGHGVLKRAGDTPGVQAMGRWTPTDFSVAAATGAVALGGALLMSVGILSEIGAGWAHSPFWFVGTMHAFVPSLLGAVLMVLAAGLALRVKQTWQAAIAALLAGAAFTAMQGGGAWIALALLAAALVLAPFGRAFYRDASLFSGKPRAGTVLPLVVLVACVGMLARLEPRLAARDRNSFWDIILAADLPESLRVSLLLLLLAGLFALWRLLRPARATADAWDDIARRRFLTLGQGVPPPGIDGVIWGEAGRAGIVFRRVGQVLLALGDPVGDPADRVSAIWRLRDLARQDGQTPAVWRAGREHLAIYGDIGLAALPLGADGLPIGDAQDAPGPHAERFLVCSAERDLPTLLPLLPALVREAGRSAFSASQAPWP